MAVCECNLSAKDFQRIGQVVYKHCGINLQEGKQELIRARLAKMMRHGNYENVQEYLDRVLDDPDGPLFSEFIDSMSTNLTSFFRESDHFDHLGKKYLPGLLSKKNKSGQRRLRAWSAACSSGEEPYSMAMVILEALASEAPGFDARILATDISGRVLQMARDGVYDRSRAAPVPPLLRERYLVASTRRAHAVEPVPAVRKMVQFAHLNLMESWPFSGPLDVIFCRNVMIYFDKPTQQRLIGRFWDVLDRGGLLFTGHSESLTGIAHRFEYVQPTIYMKA